MPTATEWIKEGLRENVSDAVTRVGGNGISLTNAILDVVALTGRRFVFVIDEWDAAFRLTEGDAKSQEAYADWLRSLFKDITFTPVAVAGANMTGILPMKSTH